MSDHITKLSSLLSEISHEGNEEAIERALEKESYLRNIRRMLEEKGGEEADEPRKDFEYESTMLKELKQQKPSDFESDIHAAAEKGKLTSIQYLIEQRLAGVEDRMNHNSVSSAPLHCFNI